MKAGVQYWHFDHLQNFLYVYTNIITSFISGQNVAKVDDDGKPVMSSTDCRETFGIRCSYEIWIIKISFLSKMDK